MTTKETLDHIGRRKVVKYEIRFIKKCWDCPHFIKDDYDINVCTHIKVYLKFNDHKEVDKLDMPDWCPLEDVK